MASVSYTPRALADLERLCDFLAETDPRAASQTIDLNLDAAAILERHPLMVSSARVSMRARSVEVRLAVSNRPPFLPLQLFPPRKRPRQLLLDRRTPRLQRLDLARPVAIQRGIRELAGDLLLLPFQRLDPGRQ